MKTETVTVVRRTGELLGPVDWSYDFRQHFNSLCCDDAGRQKACDTSMDWLRQLAANKERFMASTYGGRPRIWQRVIEVGMYDGGPYWKPTPSVYLSGWLGGEWQPFWALKGIIEREAG